ncbi:MAG: SDR family oxidoreductase, partial [Proteobacteria bacterium]|nr:SDR family oxidoreductase [Pseudomonadota bacterium]
MGQAIAKGAAVTLVARNVEKLREVCAALATNPGEKHHWIDADFADPPALRDKVQADVDENGPVHILLNNTGGPPGGPIADAESEAFLRAFSNHLLCNHVLARTLLPGMKELAFGRIINVISTSVRQPIPGLGVSNTVRGAVASWAKTLSAEVAPFGITVNNVLPGFTATDRLASIIRAKAERTGESAESIEEQMKAEVPIGRFAQADEIAAAAVFLASPEAGYVNGVSLAVDGGRITA